MEISELKPKNVDISIEIKCEIH